MQGKKEKLLKALAKVIKNLRAQNSISKLSLEVDISKSIWFMIEQAKRDAQLSTIWKIAEALNVKPSKLIKSIEEELGEHFSFIE